MKASKYNYIVPFGERKIFFNGLTEAFFITSPEYADAYSHLIQTPDCQEEWADSFLARMKESGFIVEDDTDELDTVKEKFDSLRRNHEYHLMVLPTYQCNLRCWYCTQEHENLFMDDDILGRVKLLIKRKLEDDGITCLHISWFGGEPLMAYDKVCDLTDFAKKYAEGKGKSFSSSITTNGTLLNAERIERLRDLGINHYQITIDGDRMTHNSVKQLGTISAYDRTLDNINTIARHTSVSLRFNYTRDNLKPGLIFKTLKEKLDPEVTHNIAFTIFKVWQQDRKEVNTADVDALFDNGVAAGMYSTLCAPGICYTDWHHFDCVFPNGHVGKCDNHSPAETPGELQPDGTVLWKEDMSDCYEPHLFDRDHTVCKECLYLPVCWGPCVSKRETMLREEGAIRCVYTHPDMEMETLITNLCKTRLQRTR